MARPPCAACGQQTQLIFIKGVELDACTVCKGLWFDEGELEKVSGERPRFSPLSGASGRDCPRCAFRMRRGLIQRNLEVENCRPCEGYYLDAGELERLAQQQFDAVLPGQPAAAAPVAAVAPPDPSYAPASRSMPMLGNSDTFRRAAAAAAAAAAAHAPPPSAPPAPWAAEAPRAAEPPRASEPPRAAEVPRTAEAPRAEAPSGAEFWGASTSEVSSGFQCIVCEMRFPMNEGNFFRGALACPECTPQVQTSRSERLAGNRRYEESWDESTIGRIARAFGLTGASVRGNRGRF